MNSSLKKLKLSHNRFEGKAAEWFRKALERNETLEQLDLSWNMLRMDGAVKIARGLGVSISL